MCFARVFQPLSRRLSTPPFFSLARNIVEADANISKNEDNLLNQYLDEMSLNIEQITDISEDDAIGTFLNTSSRVRKQVFIELFALTLCDNELAREEDELISRYADSLQISAQDQEKMRACVIDLLQVYGRMNSLVEE
jgi:uncharacterized tellurite resistance protein B-like protein